MGLDMYLYANFFLSDFDFRDRMHPTRVKCRAVAEAVGVSPSPRHPCVSVQVAAAYWRKANAIHAWFVDNVQGGEDECQESGVTREQLQQLVNACSAVIDAATVTCEEDQPPEDREAWYEWLLPALRKYEVHVSFPHDFESPLQPRSGFFFGGTDLDAGYLWDMLDTKQQLTTLLTDSRYDDADFVYRASW